eukprot:scaffold108678_cov27-Phaeocystis_antarctica.AAC.2
MSQLAELPRRHAEELVLEVDVVPAAASAPSPLSRSGASARAAPALGPRARGSAAPRVSSQRARGSRRRKATASCPSTRASSCRALGSAARRHGLS